MLEGSVFFFEGGRLVGVVLFGGLEVIVEIEILGVFKIVFYVLKIKFKLVVFLFEIF